MNSTDFQNALLEVQHFLEERWEIQKSNESTFQFTYVCNAGIPVTCIAWINPQLEAFFFRVVQQIPVELNRRSTLAEYLTRANYPLPIGNFALDYETGDLRFKSGIYFNGTTLSRPLIRSVVESSLEFVELHILIIVKLMMGESLEDGHTAPNNPSTKEKPRPPFSDFIQGYLQSLFFSIGLADVTQEEITAFQAHLEKSFGTQYLLGLYSGVPKQDLNEPTMRAAYEKGTLRFSAGQSGMDIVKAYAQEILHRRAM